MKNLHLLFPSKKIILNENVNKSSVTKTPIPTKSIKNTSDKFLLVKGLNGFGNMISCLNICFHLANKFDRILVIDWENCIWHDTFDNYFKLINVKYMSFNEFINIHKNNKNIYPPVFKNSLTLPFDVVIKKHGFKKMIEPIKYLNSNIDIVIISLNYHKIAFQHFNDFWKNITPTDNLLSLINSKINELGTYKAIHIRNSDQLQLNNKWIIDFLTHNQNFKIYVATDDIQMLDFCKQYHNNIYNFTNFFSSTQNKPLHYLECNDYYKKNCDAIIDLYILANSIQFVYATEIIFKNKTKHSSSYSILAQKLFDYLHNKPDIDYNYVSFKKYKLI